MKPVKRRFLKVDEKLIFNKKNKYQVTKYFNPKDFDIKNLMYLHFEYSEAENKLNTIEITAHYIDVSKCHILYEPNEYLVDEKIIIPEVGIEKKDKLLAVFPTKQDTKWLWKINFKLTEKYKTLIHLIVS